MEEMQFESMKRYGNRISHRLVQMVLSKYPDKKPNLKLIWNTFTKIASNKTIRKIEPLAGEEAYSSVIGIHWVCLHSTEQTVY